ncbi:MAG: 50S ribosomal protein L4 [Bacteroidales bacterium]|jgi:large subunit ribosomal protein L4|nr:50S ribosomal protein L4 [Bacteroidales bacterium]MBQ2514447.1 50S ribosomal protein L4 [Bacteroidales bacterium]MBQ3850573.1 50S ribosomal protein L4 [Bacteroidales bacterium]MBR3466710.1 50S ribosomal protein L4 [Bacteroidales bacterium]MBR4638815.1 50S ribosomal protein L4 [Bacteroidales bacterium]
MELRVYKIDGSETARTATLNDKIFNVEPNDHAIWLDVKQYLANQRQGTHNTLERSTVSGSTRKLKRQKGTGGARAGSIKSPTIRGGATVFGPHPRDYGFKLNKKVKRLARFSAFTYKQQEGCITVVEDFTFNAPKTKEYKAMLKNLNLEGKKTLLLLPENDRNVFLSGRNLQRTNIMRAIEANTYHVLNANNLIICESSLKELDKMLGE